jgi:hypothetical protein
MGLAVEVGNWGSAEDEELEQYYRQEFAELARVLAAHGSAWSPPGSPAPADARRKHIRSFPYPSLHYLRRVYALQVAGRAVTPAADDQEVARDAGVVDDVAAALASHLLNHADDSGYYVPVPMPTPLVIADAGSAGSGMVGSSQGLLAELVAVAPAIGIELERDGALSDAEASRVFDHDGAVYGTERMVWLTLHEACLESIRTGQPIVFT